jgi:hypothetical protein
MQAEGPSDRNGGLSGAVRPSGESSGEDSELYAGEPTPKQYGQLNHGKHLLTESVSRCGCERWFVLQK